MADLANKNSISDGVLVNDKSKAKSSAANISPERYGEALQIPERSVTALADSMSARMLSEGLPDCPNPSVCRWGSAWRMTSVTKFRSDGPRMTSE
ncbi:MAG: hypothetical protein Q9201_005762 [Fulgogasparrea decipioides]